MYLILYTTDIFRLESFIEELYFEVMHVFEFLHNIFSVKDDSLKNFPKFINFLPLFSSLRNLTAKLRVIKKK